MKIRTKMLLLFSLVITCSVFFMSYFTVVTYSGKLENSNTLHSNQVLTNLTRNLDNYFSELENVSGTIVYNNYIQNYLIGRKVEPETSKGGLVELYRASSQNFQTSMEILSNIIYTRQDFCSILILTGDRLSMYKSSNIHVDSSFPFSSQEWYRKTLEANGRPVVTSPHPQEYLTQNPETVFSLSRSFQSYGTLGYQGVLLIDVNLKRINTYCESARLNNDGFLLITDKKGTMVYRPQGTVWPSTDHEVNTAKLLKAALPRFQQAVEGVFRTSIEKEEYQIVYKTMEKADWTVMAVTPYKSIISETDDIRNLIVLVGLVCLLVILAIVYLISTKMTTPIIKLKNYMDQADHGNLGVRASIRSNDEVGMLAVSFNHMLERIEALMKEVVREQEAKRKSELKALQHQINPHFLYNTLDSIIWMAESKDENIVPMTEALSRLFRISLSRGQELIPLSDELDHVRHYLFIQSMRYLNKFDFEIHCDESLLRYKTLKLILQPLVENSIYHGIKNKAGKGHIRIHAKREKGHLQISIFDDGVGMDAETLENLQNGSISHDHSKGSSIGVRNVDERIKLYFGKEYGTRFESAPGTGTTAYVTLPLLED